MAKKLTKKFLAKKLLKTEKDLLDLTEHMGELAATMGEDYPAMQDVLENIGRATANMATNFKGMNSNLAHLMKWAMEQGYEPQPGTVIHRRVTAQAVADDSSEGRTDAVGMSGKASSDDRPLEQHLQEGLRRPVGSVGRLGATDYESAGDQGTSGGDDPPVQQTVSPPPGPPQFAPYDAKAIDTKRSEAHDVLTSTRELLRFLHQPGCSLDTDHPGECEVEMAEDKGSDDGPAEVALDATHNRQGIPYEDPVNYQLEGWPPDHPLHQGGT